MGYSINKTDVAALRFLYKTDAAARYILESLAKRRNNWKITTISSLFSIFQLAGLKLLAKTIKATQLARLGYSRPKTEGYSRQKWLAFGPDFCQK